jgi:plastocyanin
VGRDHNAYADPVDHACREHARDQGISQRSTLKEKKKELVMPMLSKRRLYILGSISLSLAASLLTVRWAITNAIAAPAPVVVKMLDTPASFEPKTLTVSPGTTVEWQNVGNSVHHATDNPETAINGADVASPDGAPFDSGFMRPGEAFTHTFTKPGVYKYACVVHEASGMIGEVIVKSPHG